MVAIALHAAVADGALIKFGAAEYTVEAGDSFAVEVIYEVLAEEGPIEVANAGFEVEATLSSGIGTMTTTTDDVVQSSMDPYIFVPSAGFFGSATSDTVAMGGDNTADGLNDTLDPGEYYLASITWHTSLDADGDFSLDFTSLGILTVLTDEDEEDYLTGSVAAVVHVVPEPAALALLALGGLALLRQSRAR